MSTLDMSLLSQLKHAIQKARVIAENAIRTALEQPCVGSSPLLTA